MLVVSGLLYLLGGCQTTRPERHVRFVVHDGVCLAETYYYTRGARSGVVRTRVVRTQLADPVHCTYEAP